MKVAVVKSVERALNEIIKQKNYATPPEINVVRGSEDGDGYASKTYAITIKESDGKTINFFVKYLAEETLDTFRDILTDAFQTEFRFYNEIYPAFSDFQKQRNVREPFNNVPKHHTTKKYGDNDAPPIFLENLRMSGYTLRDRKAPIDDNHVRLPIKAFAKFHAISYAMKDQNPELYKKLSSGFTDFFSNNYEKFGMKEVMEGGVQQLIASLDSVKDKKILDGCKNLAEKMLSFVTNIPSFADEYSVLTQGDCWSNNMMFLYDDKTGLATNVKLIDWQCIRINSPLLDFSYFFYTLANEILLENADNYLNLYYQTLAQHIRDLGSDPEKMYPYEAFRKHWKKFAIFGLSTAFGMVKALLYEKDEIPDLTKDNFGDHLLKPIKQQDRFISIMKKLVEYFIDNDLIPC